MVHFHDTGCFCMKNDGKTLLQECHGKISVMAVTGIRSEYDLMYPLLLAMSKSEKFEVMVVVTGAHLTAIHEHSVKEIENDGFNIVSRIHTSISHDDNLHRVKSCSELMAGLGEAIAQNNPDLLLVLGDREEPLISAVVANYATVPIVHLAGGDSTNPEGGNVDEQSRHATTKLSHLHLTMTDNHTKRILQLGEEPWRVITVGSGGVDRLRMTPHMSPSELAKESGLSCVGRYGVLIHHPLNGDFESAKTEILNTVKAAKSLGLQVIVGSPNSDPGSSEIVKFIDNLAGIEVYRNLPRVAFINLLRHAAVLLGNSSLAFHEADYMGLPCINVGERQRGREHSGNVIFSQSSQGDISTALSCALTDKSFRSHLRPNQSLYGDGFMAERTLEILETLPIKRKLLAKKLMY